ncbi:glucuronyl hydrolase [Paenibacillus nanensis]|uniref:Glucuronyl hydrolase n=1 Tax=Paenibacillus nanensis TaxID=393251 RepID=A0A3A1V0H4_9BACL|nr:glycoside hydrolase family 88 protein [Paenibacillus nanensis]RIX53231.1 glucuronyl hydrolase [Paenibacillus nanensis]
MLQAALKDAIDKTRKNIARFNGKFPHVSENDVYQLNDNTDWTNGFWSGMLWLSYELTKEADFREAAVRTVGSFRDRLASHTVLDHHDIGFLYSLSAKAQWIIEGDESAKSLALGAADVLMKRWRPKSGLIQAWGQEGHEKNGGRIIIDCLMNLPLLFWAAKHTGDDRYAEIAVQQAEKSRRFLVRGDDSSYHTFYFDQETGEPLRGGTEQGYADGSTWTRGQAWGIYGFALLYHFTGDTCYQETSLRMAKHFLERLPEDGVVYWDFSAPITPETKRDSSASAITICGIHELLKRLPSGHPDRAVLEEGVRRQLDGLIGKYATIGKPDAEGLLERGSYSVRGNASPDDYMIWGDYYYMEALARLTEGHKGYWYE